MTTRRRPGPETLLPLKPVEFEMLLVLHDGELHGYGLAKAIEARTGNRMRLEPANLYRRVRRLVSLGLVEEAGHRGAVEAGAERRRYFRITEYGRSVLGAEAQRLRELVEAAAERKLIPRTRRA
jgi:DNA-binding PadR family transcriptional regulator